MFKMVNYLVLILILARWTFFFMQYMLVTSLGCWPQNECWHHLSLKWVGKEFAPFLCHCDVTVNKYGDRMLHSALLLIKVL